RMVCFCTSASSAAGLVLSVMASVCARASWAAGIAASIGRKDMNHEFIPWRQTMMTDDEREAWLAIRKEAGLKIDPQTAEVDWGYALTLDPYGVYPERNTNRSGGHILPVLLETTCGSILAICPRRRETPCGRSTDQSWPFRRDLKPFSQ